MQHVDGDAAPRRGQAADRVMQALEAIADAPNGLGVSQLGRLLGIDKSTAHRLLATMTRRGFVRMNPYTHRYVLGLRLVMLGAVAARSIDLTEIARPYLEQLRDDAQEATSVAVLSQDEVLSIARVAMPGVLTVDQGVGTRMPIHSSALGKVLVAGLGDHSVIEAALTTRELTRFTPRTITDPGDLLRHLRVVTTRGWALDDEELTAGLRCLAAPIRDADGTVSAAVGIAGPASRVTLERVDELAQAVCRTGRAISEALGWRPTAVRP